MGRSKFLCGWLGLCCGLLTLSGPAVSADADDDAAFEEVAGFEANYARQLFQKHRNPDIDLQPRINLGERLKFQASWKNLPAGTIELSTKRLRKIRGQTAVVVEMIASPNDFLAGAHIYGVTTKTQANIDLATGHSYHYRREQDEYDKRILTESQEFDYANQRSNNWIATESKKNKEEKVRTPTYFLGGHVQDPLSIFYYARGLPLEKPGDKVSVILGNSKAPALISLQVVGVDTVNLKGLGTFDCLIVEPKGDGTMKVDNLIGAKGGAKIWLEKTTRIPVKIQVELFFGDVTATLVEAENTALPLAPLKK